MVPIWFAYKNKPTKISKIHIRGRTLFCILFCDITACGYLHEYALFLHMYACSHPQTGYIYMCALDVSQLHFGEWVQSSLFLATVIGCHGNYEQGRPFRKC